MSVPAVTLKVALLVWPMRKVELLPLKNPMPEKLVTLLPEKPDWPVGIKAEVPSVPVMFSVPPMTLNPAALL